MSEINEYQWRFEGICPVNGRIDKYFAKMVVLDGLIKVEELLKFCEEKRDDPMFQEEWTKLLCDRFGGKVTLLGWHKGGVRIESRCDPGASQGRDSLAQADEESLV